MIDLIPCAAALTLALWTARECHRIKRQIAEMPPLPDLTEFRERLDTADREAHEAVIKAIEQDRRETDAMRVQLQTLAATVDEMTHWSGSVARQDDDNDTAAGGESEDAR